MNRTLDTSDTARTPKIGADVLGLITSGIYDTPLAAIREYIQNAADAYASVGDMHGRVEIWADPAELRLTIRDYGPGLSAEDALRNLVPVARSYKIIEQDRGFRGIGRLAGLAFADQVKFVTRAKGSEQPFQVSWDGALLRRCMARGKSAAEAIEESVSFGVLETSGHHAETFFEVEIMGVARYAAPQLLNREMLRKYVSEVCPVPLSDAFSFGGDIREAIRQKETLCELRICLDGESEHVARGFANTFRLSESRGDVCSRVEIVDIPNIDGSGSAALAWFAHSSYLGAISRAAGIRGIRARVGNIQVGSESSLEALFDEERFNRWCMGEVHVLDRRILPNARRDYFEPNPHLQSLESKLNVHFHRLSAQCRKASSERNRRKKRESEISDLSQTLELAASRYIDPSLALELCTATTSRLQKVKAMVTPLEKTDSKTSLKVESLERELLKLRVNLEELAEQHEDDLESQLLHALSRSLLQHVKSTSQTLQVIEAVGKELAKRK